MLRLFYNILFAILNIHTLLEVAVHLNTSEVVDRSVVLNQSDSLDTSSTYSYLESNVALLNGISTCDVDLINVQVQIVVTFWQISSSSKVHLHEFTFCEGFVLLVTYQYSVTVLLSVELRKREVRTTSKSILNSLKALEYDVCSVNLFTAYIELETYDILALSFKAKSSSCFVTGFYCYVSDTYFLSHCRCANQCEHCKHCTFKEIFLHNCY